MRVSFLGKNSIRVGRVVVAKGLHRPNNCTHGPQQWPWWRLFSLNVVRLGVHPPSSGRRLWIYTRWWARCFDAYVDRRTWANG